MSFNMPPSYDAWLTGGDPHDNTVTATCDNPNCDMAGVFEERAVRVEYGVYDPDSDLVCRYCGETMVET